MANIEFVFGTPGHYVVASLIILAAEIIYVTFGFGAGLFSIGLLALVLPSLKDCVIILLLINLPLELTVTLKSWKALEWKGIFPVILGITAGIPGGTLLLKAGSPFFLLKILGILLVFSGFVFILVVNTRKRKAPRSPGSRLASFPACSPDSSGPEDLLSFFIFAF